VAQNHRSKPARTNGIEQLSNRPASAFALPERLHAKSAPAQIAADDAHFAAIARSLVESIADLSERVAEALQQPGGVGQNAMERDEEIHRLNVRLRSLRRFGLDLCLGHMVSAQDEQPVYIGRLGLTDRDGQRLLLDWRSPAAEPFFGGTHANPMGLISRRRYRWTAGQISDYWDEVFTDEGLTSRAALDDQSAFIASLGSNRSPQMRDVLTTIQSDQDAIIRAGSHGSLVVDGGPGTGKTVVALHRTAYLLYADPRLGHRRGGVLFVGPHQPYLTYIADVLPSLGEEGVQTCTVRGLLPEGASAADESDPEVARLKSTADMVRAIEPAVRFYETPPTQGMEIETPYADIWVSVDDWADAFDARAPGTPHNEARDEIWEELVTILASKVDIGSDPDANSEEDDRADEEMAGQVRRSIAQSAELAEAFSKAWPIMEAIDVVGDLWDVPAYLRLCAPWLSTDEVKRLQRDDPRAWTTADLPLLDAARNRLGDPEASQRKRAHESVVAAERRQMDRVVDEILQLDDEDGLNAQLRQEGIRNALIDEGALRQAVAEPLAGPFAHIVVDEAQELTDAEWQMLLTRCPSRSFTIVGDRAQARHGFAESWSERLTRVGLDQVELASLSINYRTPEEIMVEAEPIIRSVLPDANVPTSIRSTGVPVQRASLSELDTILATWLAEHKEGTACVIGSADFEATDRVSSLTPTLAKGLEFDLVVLVDPEGFGEGIEGAVDRYVAMTRATQQLVLLAT
jgi:DNA helicase IV